MTKRAAPPATRPGRVRPPAGLTAAEVRARVAAGRVNRVETGPSRTTGQILRANLLTRFNAILGVLLLVIIVVGPFQDALFGIVLAANALVGIVQEWRAKRSLDRLALLAAPRVLAWRDEEEVEVAVDEVVLDDVLRLRPGDQVVVDGTVAAAAGLEIDESLLSGEADPIPKDAGDEVLSGSFVAAGTGWYRATRVGPDAFAARLASEARRFTLARSELRAGTDRILRWITWFMIPTAALLVSTQLMHNEDLADALRGSVAGVGSMVPEGLVLLTSVAMALAVVRLGRRRVLVQELAAVETLARVDVVCLDKTGTLTEGAMSLAAIEVLGPYPAQDALGAMAAADDSPNATMQAVAGAFPAPRGWRAERIVPFSSARKWSGASFGAAGAWVLGAPEVLLDQAPDADVAAAVDRRAAFGQRVLLLARAGRLDGDSLPGDLTPAAVVVLEDRLRPEAAGILRWFADEGVTCKVLSGDDPRTVAALAARLGLPTGRPVDGRTLPTDPTHLGEVMESGTLFGRVTPQQKRAMVDALQARGHVVAMTGDGVNDVLALKDADIGVALASGSGAARAVSQVVLLDSSFDTLPAVVGEGRRVIANIERVAKLFLTKTAYATLLCLAVGVARLPFPFLPRHLTLVTSLTIGIPAFFLALEPNAARAKPGFVGRSLVFSVPAGAVAAAATFVAYATLRVEDLTLAEARTTATIVLFVVAYWALLAVARPLNRMRAVLVVAMAVCFGCALAFEGLRQFYGLALPPVLGWLTAAILATSAVFLLEVGWQVANWRHQWRMARRAG
ncbi:MAG TPA: HAD-IC family P-type ATPase [Acidimicrobiales bacterium]|nr:HAD-IC family P-type ATPase [Acidimicrobiales bacterium]